MKCLGLMVFSLALLGCPAGDSREVVVEVRTDLVPGVEFVEVSAELVAGSTASTKDRGARVRENWWEGQRVGVFSDVGSENIQVRATLLDGAGRVVAARTVSRTVPEGTFGLTILITRECSDGLCPRPTDAPDLTSCLGGRCVNPRCDETSASCGTPECTAAGECGEESGCLKNECVLGTCLSVPDNSRCEIGAYCTLDGCLTGAGDAGMDAGMDSGTDGGLDAGTDARLDAAEDPGLLDSGPEDAASDDGTTDAGADVVERCGRITSIGFRPFPFCPLAQQMCIAGARTLRALEDCGAETPPCESCLLEALLQCALVAGHCQEEYGCLIECSVSKCGGDVCSACAPVRDVATECIERRLDACRAELAECLDDM